MTQMSTFSFWTCEGCGREFAPEVESYADGFCAECYARFYPTYEGREPWNLDGKRCAVLVSGGTKSTAAYDGDKRIGRLQVPGAGNRTDRLWGTYWACDNGAFAGFDAPRFLAMLDRHQDVPGCLFVTCPDVVGDHAGTMELWHEWMPRIAGAGFPVAFVLQDGATVATIPWDDMDALFVGGTTEFKLAAAPFIAEAHRRGKWVHVGRVNSQKRLRWAMGVGADSVDGTGFSRFGESMLPQAIRVLDSAAAAML